MFFKPHLKKLPVRHRLYVIEGYGHEKRNHLKKRILTFLREGMVTFAKGKNFQPREYLVDTYVYIVPYSYSLF